MVHRYRYIFCFFMSCAHKHPQVILIKKKNTWSHWMDSGKTFYIFSKIRTTFPCVVCSAERPLVEEKRRPEQVFGVLAGWQQQTVVEKAQLWQTDRDKSRVNDMTPWQPQLLGSEFMWSQSSSSLHGNPKSGRKNAWQKKTKNANLLQSDQNHW